MDEYPREQITNLKTMSENTNQIAGICRGLESVMLLW